jgi:RNA polymerase sigma-70 factor (ECF subfamily)
MTSDAPGEDFDSVVLPHLEAGVRLARWLMRNGYDAEDAVQDAVVRAFKYFRTFIGGDSRAWFLRIVRNTCTDRLERRQRAPVESFDEQAHWDVGPVSTPETLLLKTDDATLVTRAMQHLPARLHRVLALRELEGLSYRELADVTGLPLGTVMSRLSRAREALRSAVDRERSRNIPASGPIRPLRGTGCDSRSAT